MIRVHLENGIMEVTLDSRKGNMLSKEDIVMLAEHISAAAEDQGVSGLLLTGAGAAFCTGLDIDPTAGNPEYVEEVFRLFDGLLLQLFVFPKPVVAAVNGHSIGGGLLLQSAADRVVAADHPRIKLGLPEVKLGIAIDKVMYELLAFNAASPKTLASMLLGGAYYTPGQAVALGFIDELTSGDSLMATARAQMAELASLPAAAYRETKELVKRTTAQRMML
jgi:enoyl-CoA hydratase/carnithine racemase